MPYKISIVNKKFVGHIAQTKHVQIIIRYINVRLPLIHSSGPMFKKNHLGLGCAKLDCSWSSIFVECKAFKICRVFHSGNNANRQAICSGSRTKKPPPQKIKIKLSKFHFFYYFAIVSFVKWYKRQWTLFE